MRRAARRDENHAEIRNALRDCGWHVIDMGSVGDGLPDLLVIGPAGRIVLVEVKAPGGRLTAKQRELRQQCDSRRAAYAVVRNPDQAIGAVLTAAHNRGSEDA